MSLLFLTACEARTLDAALDLDQAARIATEEHLKWLTARSEAALPVVAGQRPHQHARPRRSVAMDNGSFRLSQIHQSPNHMQT